MTKVLRVIFYMVTVFLGLCWANDVNNANSTTLDPCQQQQNEPALRPVVNLEGSGGIDKMLPGANAVLVKPDLSWLSAAHVIGAENNSLASMYMRVVSAYGYPMMPFYLLQPKGDGNPFEGMVPVPPPATPCVDLRSSQVDANASNPMSPKEKSAHAEHVVRPSAPHGQLSF